MARVGGLFGMTILAVILALSMSAFVPAVNAQAPAPAPPPASDGHAIDQGIAYTLLVVALVLTYLIHPLDAAFPSFF